MHISEELYYFDKLGSLMNFCGKWRRTLWSWSVDIFCIFSTSSSSLNTKQLCWWHNWSHKSLNCQFCPLSKFSTYFDIVLRNQIYNFDNFEHLSFLTQISFFQYVFLNVDLGDVLLKFKHQNKLYDYSKMIFLTQHS